MSVVTFASSAAELKTTTLQTGSWPVMGDAAYHGLAGDFVRTMQPHTEADPAGLLIQFLTTFGNIVGHCPYYLVEGDKHHTNLFNLLIGFTSKSRKGTSAGRVR